VNGAQNNQVVQSLRTPFLPFLSLKFITDTMMIAAGHDCYPVIFSLDNNGIRIVEKLQVSASKTASV
jgi:actin related protein 2/3 complex subunit 1A/1B